MLLSSSIYERASSIVVGIIPATIVDKSVFLYYDTKRNDYYFPQKERAPMRVKVVLQCTETGDRNYITTKNKRNNPESVKADYFFPKIAGLKFPRRTLLILLFFLLEPLFP